MRAAAILNVILHLTMACAKRNLAMISIEGYSVPPSGPTSSLQVCVDQYGSYECTWSHGWAIGATQIKYESINDAGSIKWRRSDPSFESHIPTMTPGKPMHRSSNTRMRTKGAKGMLYELVFDKHGDPLYPPAPPSTDYNKVRCVPAGAPRTNVLFATLLLGLQRLERTQGLPLAHPSMLEEMLENWTMADHVDRLL